MFRRTYTPLITLVVALATMAVGCGDLGSFTFTEESEEQTVEGEGSVTGGLPLPDAFPDRIPMEVNLDQELEEQDASGAKAVYLTDLRLKMTENTEEPNFDFLDEITLEVSSDEQPTRTLAWEEPVPTGADEFALRVDDEIDLKPYAEEGMRLRTSVSGSAPEEDAKFKVSATFRVEVL